MEMVPKPDGYEKTPGNRSKTNIILKPLNIRLVFLGIWLIAVQNQLSIQAQEIDYAVVYDYNELFYKVIGLDENLINGYKYINENNKMGGHAFLGSEEFKPGKLVINNQSYTNVSLLYDILNQDILLSYKNSFGNINYLVLQKSFISEFEINNMHFKKLHFADTGTQFFQVVSGKKIMCLYFWEKTLSISSSSLESYYNYSDQSKRTYLVINDTLRQYKGKHSFVKLFPEESRGEIKKYMKKHIKDFRNASDGSIRKLIAFCEGIKPEGNIK